MDHPTSNRSNRSSSVHPLGAGHEAEVLAFPAVRPLHTALMAGFIRDNGLVSSHHRGTFNAYCNEEGELEGIALIGHHTLIEARMEPTFARLICAGSSAHMIMAEADCFGESSNLVVLRLSSPGRIGNDRRVCKNPGDV
ncbi:MAG: hypothetical protein M3R15_26030 [Acidobacteriota bacterium]|nr:hypothetical protein [Acidobacteriota bacterium]